MSAPTPPAVRTEPEIPAAAAPPSTWVEHVSSLAVAHNLPPLLADPATAWRVRGLWQLHPWAVRHDIGALLAWMRHLDAPVSIWRVPGQDGAVAIDGTMAGHPTRLVGHTHRLPTDGIDPLTSELLKRIAITEARGSSPEVDVTAKAWFEPVPTSPPSEASADAERARPGTGMERLAAALAAAQADDPVVAERPDDPQPGGSG